jgi:heme oxygenase
MMDQQLLHNLRAQTRPLHDRLEAIVDGARLMKPPFDQPHYARLLRAHLAFNLSVNEQFASGMPFEVRIPAWPEADRVTALKEDLKALDVNAAGEGMPAMPLAENAAFVAGLCYVAEGAAMGNQMIYKALLQHPEFAALGADRYMQQSKAGLSGRWKAFQQVLGHYLKVSEESVIAGAKAGFLHFEGIWLALS